MYVVHLITTETERRSIRSYHHKPSFYWLARKKRVTQVSGKKFWLDYKPSPIKCYSNHIWLVKQGEIKTLVWKVRHGIYYKVINKSKNKTKKTSTIYYDVHHKYDADSEEGEKKHI